MSWTEFLNPNAKILIKIQKLLSKANFLISKRKIHLFSPLLSRSNYNSRWNRRTGNDRQVSISKGQTKTNATQDHETPLSVFFKVRTGYQERLRLSTGTALLSEQHPLRPLRQDTQKGYRRATSLSRTLAGLKKGMR